MRTYDDVERSAGLNTGVSEMNEHVKTSDHIPNHVEERYRLWVKLVSLLQMS